jgi:hypothetical protein
MMVMMMAMMTTAAGPTEGLATGGEYLYIRQGRGCTRYERYLGPWASGHQHSRARKGIHWGGLGGWPEGRRARGLLHSLVGLFLLSS